MDILAGLLALIANLGVGAGYLANQSARQFLLQELDQAEVLEVQIQSTPNYRLLQGEADRLLIAGRGLYRKPFPRIDILELETDPLAINPSVLQGQPLELERALQAAIRVVVTVEDLNTALQSPEVLEQFQDLKADLPGQPQTRFDLRDPQAQFLPDNRIQLSAQLVQRTPDGQPSEESVEILFVAGFAVENGQQVRLVNPEFTIGSVRVPDEISSAFLGGLNVVFNLQDLEAQGLTVRVLKLALTPQALEVIGFVRIESLPSDGNPSTVGVSSLR
ncbi:MAG: DUF2993 domain-containing protein [Cyanobacteriota bacterium]|nr:DUF2993 domain-containing protein [Cyanobacteriota bacterium]